MEIKLVKELIIRFNLLAYLDKNLINIVRRYIKKLKKNKKTMLIKFFIHLDIISICIPTILRHLQEDPLLSTKYVKDLVEEF